MLTGRNIGNKRFQQELYLQKKGQRRFAVTKTYNGKIPEVDHFTEQELLNEPIHPFIKECIRHPDFDKLTITYFTQSTTISIIGG